MSKFKITLVFLTFFITTKSFSESIVVINIEEIINNNLEYKKIIKKIDDSQKLYLKEFNNEDEKIQDLYNEIESSKLILNDNELSIMIDNYNKKIEDQNSLINNFNNHYQNEIIKIRKKIFNEIISLLEKYAINNNIDLILDSNSYLIASNKINITNFIEKKINELKLKLEFRNFE